MMGLMIPLYSLHLTILCSEFKESKLLPITTGPTVHWPGTFTPDVIYVKGNGPLTHNRANISLFTAKGFIYSHAGKNYARAQTYNNREDKYRNSKCYPLAFVHLHVAFTSYSFPPSAMVSLSWSLLLKYMERVRKPIVSRVKISNKCLKDLRTELAEIFRNETDCLRMRIWTEGMGWTKR